MSNKNPFELRSEILQMAKDYLDQQYHVNMDFARRTFDEAVKIGTATTENYKSYVPAMYSLEELTKKAQELYGFVSNKDA